MAGSLQRTRGFRLEKVKNAPGSDASEAKTYTFRANDGEFDRCQDRLSVQGWDLKSFNANPVILYNHDAGDGGFLGLGRKDVLPIGKGKAYVQGNALFVDVQFDQQDEFAKKVESKVDQGILNAVSVRYTIPDGAYTENEKGGLDSTAQELLEISIVTIPGNQRALRVKGFDEPTQHNGDKMTPEQIAKMIEDGLAKAALAAAAKQKADAEAVKAAEEAKAAEELKIQAKVDEAVSKIMGDARGQRSAPFQASGVEVGDRASRKEKGLDFARFIKAKAVAALDKKSIVDVVKEWNEKSPGMGYGEFAKALSSASFSGMGSLVRQEWASDFIELLRNTAVLRQAGAQVITGGQRLVFDGQAAGGTAYWGGETSNITASNPTTNQPLALSAKKLTALCPIPNDLLRNTTISADQFVLKDLGRVVSLEEDVQFIYGNGTSGKPMGIALQLASGNSYAMAALGVAAVPTVLEMKKEIDKALKVMELANAPMTDVAIFSSPSPKAAILDAVASSGDGSNMLEMEYTRSKTLRGKKAFFTNQITETGVGGGGTSGTGSLTTNGNAVKQSDLLFFDMSEVIILDSLNLEAEVFPNGHYYNGSTVVSGISTDQSVVRLIKETDIGLRHNVSGVRVYNVTWGNP
jgi:HK97 family phage major capsid protein